MKQGDMFLKQLKQPKLVWDYFIKNTVLHIPDWLNWSEYIWANRN